MDPYIFSSLWVVGVANTDGSIAFTQIFFELITDEKFTAFHSI